MTKILLGPHELRILATDPVLVYVRLVGELTAPQARSIVQVLAPKLSGQRSQFLVDSAALGTLGPDSRRELTTGGPDSHRWPALVADIVLVGASMLQKVVLAQIVSAASQYQAFYGQTHFFDSLEDALQWLGVPASLLTEATSVLS